MGAKIQEGRAWDPTNSDGSLNVGSYEVAAGVGATDLAFELLTGQHNFWDVTVPVDDPDFWLRVNDLAAALLNAADIAQAAARNDGRHDRFAGSHPRARGAVRTVLAAHPAPDLADRDAVAAWGIALGDTAARLLVTAIGLVDEDHAARSARRNWPDINTAKHRLLNAVAAAHPHLDPDDHKAAAAEAWAAAGLPDTGTVPADTLAGVIATVAGP